MNALFSCRPAALLSGLRAIVALCGLASIPAVASPVSFVGDLDPLNANDVLLLTFTLAAPGDVTIQSWGYGGTSAAPGGVNAAGEAIAAGGFDSYLSLFAGLGDGAVFLASNDDGACPVGHAAPACHDASLHLSGLAAGNYTLALSVFLNMSFAENFGSGTLGDGFIGLGNYYDFDSNSVRTSHYAIDIAMGDLVVPEPSSLLLVGLALLLLSARWRRPSFATPSGQST